MPHSDINGQCQQAINALGLKCPMPVIKLQQAVRKHPKHSIIAILFDDPTGTQDICSWAKVNKHQILEVNELGQGVQIILKTFQAISD